MPADSPRDGARFQLRSFGRQWTFVRPDDPDRILNALSEEQYEKDQFLPYWAELWPSTEVLVAHLGDLVGAKRGWACDLGCGLGVVGSLLAAIGFTTVAVDIAPDACVYAAVNMREHSSQSRVVCGDWRSHFLRARFDLITAADVLYEDRWVTPVLQFLSDHLAPGAVALIADPCRKSWTNFLERATTDGFEPRIEVRAPSSMGGVVEVAALRCPGPDSPHKVR